MEAGLDALRPAAVAHRLRMRHRRQCVADDVSGAIVAGVIRLTVMPLLLPLAITASMSDWLAGLDRVIGSGYYKT
jgi:hypothetical protein